MKIVALIVLIAQIIISAFTLVTSALDGYDLVTSNS